MSVRVNYHDYDICAKSFEDLSRIISGLIKDGRIEEAIQQIKDCIYYRMYIRHTKYHKPPEFNKNDSHDDVILQLEKFKRELIELEKLFSNSKLYESDFEKIEYYRNDGFKFVFYTDRKQRVFDRNIKIMKSTIIYKMDGEYTREQKDYKINEHLDELLLDDYYFKEKTSSGGKPKKRRTKKRKSKRRKTRKERK